MSKEIAVTLRLNDDLLRALGRAAARAGASPTDYLRALLAQALDSDAAAPDQTIRLALALARDWPDLQSRLRRAGFALRRAPDSRDLLLCRWPLMQALIPLARLGVSVEGLVLRFGADLPPDGRAYGTGAAGAAPARWFRAA